MNSGKLWKQSNLETRRELQSCLFPDGIRYRQGAILNTIMCPIFSGLEAFSVADARMASPSNAILNTWVDWATQLGKLKLMLQPG